jgi:DNA end-binding protein Ku
MRGKEYLAAVRADGAVLALHTLHFADEVRDPSELDNVPTRRTKPGEKELKMATQLIESMSGPWKPEQYRDTYRDRVEQLIEDKKQGKEIVTESEPPEPTETNALLEALQRSVEEARGKKSGKSGGKSGDKSSSGSRRKAS